MTPIATRHGSIPPRAAGRAHRPGHAVHARTEPSTRPRSASSSAGRSSPASTASSRSGRPARRRPCPRSERDRLIALTVETVAERPSRRRVAIVAGTGTNDTAATIRATRRAADLGADAALVVAPYYNRPDQRMLEAHFRAIADDGALPIVVYNVPSRTGSNLEADTFLRLAEHPGVIAIKEASGQLDQIARICRDRPRDVAVLAGDDAWTLPVLALGGDGVVSVASNEIPGEMVALCSAARAGDWDEARRVHERWLPLFIANFQGGPNPVPAKAALALMGLLGSDAVRAPLLPLDVAPRARLADQLRGARPRRAGRRPDGGGTAGGDRMIAAADLDTATLIDDLEAGRIRAAEPDPTAAGGWRVNPEVKAAILARFAEPGDPRLDGRAVLVPGPGVGRTARDRPTARGGSSRVGRAFALEPTSGPASSSCRRRTSTSAPGSASGRWSTATSSSARAPRSARTSTSRPVS